MPDLGLTEKQEERLLLLVGPRYHAKRKVLKLVCDTYPNRIDNKVKRRYTVPFSVVPCCAINAVVRAYVCCCCCCHPL